MKKVRILVVDDSAYNRRTIIKLLEELPEVEVIGYAANGEEGIRRIIDLKPDLVTLDLEMPKIDGFTLLRIIMNSCPTPVIVVSSQSEQERVFKALELGAVDFVAKPGGAISEELLKIRNDLHQKVRNVFELNLAGVRRSEQERDVPVGKRKKSVVLVSPLTGNLAAEVVAIGSSTGGPPALQKIFSQFPDHLPFAVVVSQHMPAGFTKAFAERLNRMFAFEVKEAADGDEVRPGRVLIAPGGRNLQVQSCNGQVVVTLPPPAKDERYVPSVDAMFDSLAGMYGPRLLAVVLTGMGSDGSSGVKAVKSSGGKVLAEAEESAVVFGMPREAIATGVVDAVVPLERVAREIMVRCGFLPVVE
ncbi:MAG TPA: chemotaxis response regulator protein-glutamate methylesterase [Geobacteraceae bacterium]